VNESPDTSFEYVPPKVNRHLKKKKNGEGKKKDLEVYSDQSFPSPTSSNIAC